MVSSSSSAPVLVLLVEDEPLIRMVAADALLDAGFDVLEASNADDAVQVLETRADVRIIFTDIDMPGSMNGLNLAHAVRGRWPPIEIVLTSGFRQASMHEMPDRCIFIAKPYRPANLVATLRTLAP